MNQLMERAAELMKAVDGFGVTHIISEDGNLDDSHIAFVEEQMKTCSPPPTPEERELIILLKVMTIDAREAVWDHINRPFD